MMKLSTMAVITAALLSSVSFVHGADKAAAPAASAKAATAKTNPVIADLVTLHLGRLAMKQITAIETADQIVGDARAYVKQYGPAEAKNLHDNLSLVADVYVEFVEHSAAKSTTWPTGKSKEVAQASLDMLKGDLQKPDADYLTVMRRANDVLAWTKGKPHAAADVDHFARHDVLVAYALARVPEAAKLVAPAAAVADAGAAANPPAASGAGSDSMAGATAIGTAESAVRYTCDGGLDVTAYYSEAQNTSEARLAIGTESYMLASAISASGAKYSSAKGRNAGKTLTWWTKGDEAMLIEAPSGSEDGANETIVNCVNTTPPPVDPPTPGGSAGTIQKLTVTSDDPKIAITGLLRDGVPATTEGLGTAKVIASFVMDEDGIACDSEGYEVRLANGMIYRPAINLCEAKWTLTVASARAAMPSPLPEPPKDLVWSKYPEETGKPPEPDSAEAGQDEPTEAYLAYAIPETDAFAMYGMCQKSIGRAVARFPSGDGGDPKLEIALADRTLVYGFKPITADSVSEEGGPLYELDLAVDDQLWRLLRDGTRLPYRIGNSPFMLLDASKGVDAIGKFLTACEGE